MFLKIRTECSTKDVPNSRVLLHEVFWVQKFCINTCPIINGYIATKHFYVSRNNKTLYGEPPLTLNLLAPTTVGARVNP